MEGYKHPLFQMEYRSIASAGFNQSMSSLWRIKLQSTIFHKYTPATNNSLPNEGIPWISTQSYLLLTSLRWLLTMISRLMVLTSETSIVSRWMLASLRPMPSSWWKIPVSGSIGFFMIILLMMVAREKKTCPDYFSKGNLSGFPERLRRLAISSYPVAQARYRDCRP